MKYDRKFLIQFKIDITASTWGDFIFSSDMTIISYFNIITKTLNGIKVRVVYGKSIEKKALHDKIYYYFWKSDISVTNLIVDSRNMIKVLKVWVCKKLDEWRELFHHVPTIC